MTNLEWPLPYPDALGPLIGADDVADAVVATLEKWSPYYVAMISGRVQAAKKIGSRDQPSAPLKAFDKWRNEDEFRTIGSGSPAAYQVRVTATVGEPDRQGTGHYIATWRTQVALQYWGTDWQEARDGTSWYEKAIRWSILQHRSLGGFAQSTKWIGSTFAGIEHSSSRTEGQCVMGFDVKVLDVLDDTRGPKTVPPMLRVPPMDPTVENPSVTVTAVPVTESVNP